MKEIELGKEYYIGKSNGWDWFGTHRWWEIFVIIDGFNGSGGYWLRERWRWNGSSQNIREEIKTLSLEESQEVDSKIGYAK